ncbi:MAG: isochorismate synthase [Prochlorococcus sp. SP3034]|nr:isochorismate synthase [Prochlorococcus sp. SP3034]|tara:strand:+ start:19206 stop:20600 length:1395 start_codon:yes stop_codon:yes gene_type:complete
MQNNFNFTNLLKDITTQLDHKNARSGVISICNQIPYFDLLSNYDYLQNQYSFSAIWEEKNNMSFLALDKCKYITLDGAGRFEMAKNFYYENIKNLIYINEKSNYASLAKIIYFFSFADNLNKTANSSDVPNMEAVLPKILIINDSGKSWIRFNAQFNNRSSIRQILEEFWMICNKLISLQSNPEENNININMSEFDNAFNQSKKMMIKNISKAVQLIEDKKIEKIVLSSRLNFQLDNKLNLNIILKKLKNNQNNSCIYLWSRNSRDITFGASPEKLFSIKNNKLTLEAIAGTASSKLNNDLILNNNKNLREHKFVLNYLINALKKLKINNFQKSDLQVKRFGNILHLYTFINASVKKVCPFELLENLHPSPAVCGIPKNNAFEWIQTLEVFSRGNYASPIGWVDVAGNSDFRVAIRGARYLNKEIQLTAGAGLVKDSKCIEEVEEIKLKFQAIANQIFPSKIIQ